MTREQILEERCKRFKKIILDEFSDNGLSIPEYLSYLMKEGFISFNDARYLLDLHELEDVDSRDTKKPPLGVMPRDIWNHKRWTELSNAMQRYLEAGKPVPKEWMDEYIELCEED